MKYTGDKNILWEHCVDYVELSMKSIVPGTYQTHPPPNTILTIIMTTLVLPTASRTHTFLSM